MAQRTQRKRTKGWKMPEDAVYVGRPTKWGNPFRIGDCGTVEKAVGHFKSILADRKASTFGRPRLEIARVELLPHIADIKHELRGKDLVCWCPLDQPCHADVLLEIANEL